MLQLSELYLPESCYIKYICYMCVCVFQ